jgi:hypothetical protein
VELNLHYMPCVEHEVAWKVAQGFLYDPDPTIRFAKILLKETDPAFYEYGYELFRHKMHDPTQEELEAALQNVPAHVNLEHVLRIHEEREAAGLLYVHSCLVSQAEQDYLNGSIAVLPQYDIFTMERIWRQGIKYGDAALEHMNEKNKELLFYAVLIRDFFQAPRFSAGVGLSYGMMLEFAKDPAKMKKGKKEFN